jgi:hypothetical protein
MLQNIVITDSLTCSSGSGKLWNDRRREKKESSTYVAFTSSFAGTGGIVDAEAEAEAILDVACTGALFKRNFLRDRNPIFVVAHGRRPGAQSPTAAVLGLRRGLCRRRGSGEAMGVRSLDADAVFKGQRTRFPRGLADAVTVEVR